MAEVPTVRSGLHLRVITEDFPDGPMDKNPPGNAGDTGLTPGRERFHMPGNNVVHAPQLLSVHAATTWVCMPQLLECACRNYLSVHAASTVAPAARAHAHQQGNPHSEKPTYHKKSGPHPPQPEKANTQPAQPTS